MSNYFDNTPLVKVIYKWKWHIITITLVAAILGAVFSGSKFITPLFKSSAILYPSNITAYSDETCTEQMIQIMQSQDIMDSVVDKFNLIEHYKIDKSYIYWKTALIGEYRDKVSISRTPYDAVTIVVKDNDPELACKMVNEIIRLYDHKIKTLHKTKSREVLNMFENILAKKVKEIDSIKTRLQEIGENYGVVDYSQVREYTRGELGVVTSSSKVQSDKVDDLKKNFEQFGPEIAVLTRQLEGENNSYIAIKKDYEQELRFYNADFTYSNIISSPFVADKKCYPIRWVVVALSGLAACIMSILVVYVIENKKDMLK
ncbi:MAG: hypothetical protein II817_06300 [Bacteroidales bacterium]|nr:hypothetical protein [Bacteroidales bacterium]